MVAVKTQMVGPHRVQHDQEHVGRIGRRQRTPGFAPLLDPVSREHRARHDQDQSQEARETPQQPPPQPDLMPLEQGDQTRCHSQCQDHPCFNIDLRTGHHEGRHEGTSDDEASAEPTSSTGPESGYRREEKSHRKKQQQIRQRSQPDEVPADLVQPVGWVNPSGTRRARPTSSNPAASPHQAARMSTSLGPIRRAAIDGAGPAEVAFRSAKAALLITFFLTVSSHRFKGNDSSSLLSADTPGDRHTRSAPPPPSGWPESNSIAFPSFHCAVNRPRRMAAEL